MLYPWFFSISLPRFSQDWWTFLWWRKAGIILLFTEPLKKCEILGFPSTEEKDEIIYLQLQKVCGTLNKIKTRKSVSSVKAIWTCPAHGFCGKASGKRWTPQITWSHCEFMPQASVHTHIQMQADKNSYELSPLMGSKCCQTDQ